MKPAPSRVLRQLLVDDVYFGDEQVMGPAVVAAADDADAHAAGQPLDLMPPLAGQGGLQPMP